MGADTLPSAWNTGSLNDSMCNNTMTVSTAPPRMYLPQQLSQQVLSLPFYRWHMEAEKGGTIFPNIHNMCHTQQRQHMNPTKDPHPQGDHVHLASPLLICPGWHTLLTQDTTRALFQPLPPSIQCPHSNQKGVDLLKPKSAHDPPMTPPYSERKPMFL